MAEDRDALTCDHMSEEFKELAVARSLELRTAGAQAGSAEERAASRAACLIKHAQIKTFYDDLVARCLRGRNRTSVCGSYFSAEAGPGWIPKGTQAPALAGISPAQLASKCRRWELVARQKGTPLSCKCRSSRAAAQCRNSGQFQLCQLAGPCCCCCCCCCCYP